MNVLNKKALDALMQEENSSRYVVDAHHRGIERIEELSEMPMLYSLDLSFNKLKELKHLKVLKGLKELKCYNNALKSTNGIKGNQNLEIVILNENQIEEISSDFNSLFKLKTLQLFGNKIKQIEHLKNCRHLTYLDLSRNRLSGSVATGIQTLVALEYLNLTENQLSMIGNLENLKKLEEINVSGNALESLQGIYPSTLMVLRADRNKISEITTLPTLPNLNELYVQGNTISCIKGFFEKAPQMESLDLRNNRIRSVADLAFLNTYTTLEDLWVSGNPCTLSQTYLQDLCKLLPSLQFLDNLTCKQINESPNPTKLLQEMASRPPTAGRPITPGLSRPLSASGSRPTTGEGRPLISRPSSRAGLQAKMLPQSDVEKAQNEVRERLDKLRMMMGKLCDDLQPKPPAIESHPIDIIQKQNILQTTVPLKKTCTNDMGTDPLEENMIPLRPATAPPVSTPRHEVGNQSLISSEQSILSVEESMKQLLLAGLTHVEDIEVTIASSTNSQTTESPRIVSNRHAECRARPTATERIGFRLFRIPASAKKFMQSAVAT
ncbi:phosphatase 1 regulatory subunit 7 [Thraustotheca clavata]|uniref:Phosphatase 1 regulatory subunit 7 n=1 Tax=Thraustotheca clavata TaxID=74557 RepID=A0A1V9ZVB3_9STRA|nr:phosphatase 1 regulatory subunit 7 [Thraustotheca clavata]